MLDIGVIAGRLYKAGMILRSPEAMSKQVALMSGQGHLAMFQVEKISPVTS